MANNSKYSNRTIISISSSSDEDEDEDNQQDDLQPESELECASDDDDDESDDEYDDDYDESESDGREVEDDDEIYSDDEKFDNGDGGDGPDDKRICNRVIRLLEESSDLHGLNLRECKSYLRRHGLRLSGTKAECIQRISEHWRIKDGNGEALYPRSSFSINCTGDVCKGDIVLFTQKVYEKFDKMKRRGGLLGKRTIAGRIVKESYGAAKQQHTFTVEVLWSKGLKTLPPLFPLLVKGRNLYKLRTFRQWWKSEVERLKVLDEKHRRGAAARHTRAIRKMEHAGSKRQKQFHLMPSLKKQTTKGVRGKCARSHGTARLENMKSNNHPHNPHSVHLHGPSKSRIPACSSKSYSSKNYSEREYHTQSFQGFTSSHQDVILSTSRFSHLRSALNSNRSPSSEGFNHRPHLHHAYSNSNYDPAMRNYNQYPMWMSTSRPMQPYYPSSEGFNYRPHLHHAYSNSNYNPAMGNYNQYPMSMNTSRPMYPYYPRADEYEHWK